MAFYYLLEALQLPKGSEIIFPALTFWVIPEFARVAGLKPVFADVDPRLFTLDPCAFERAITPRTSAVVPTHLYGLPCDVERIVGIARRHGLAVSKTARMHWAPNGAGVRLGRSATRGSSAFSC